MTLRPPISKTALVTAAGTAEADFPTPRNDTRFTVSQVSVSMSSAPGNATCGVYFNGFLITPLVPQADAASGDPPIVVTPTDTLAVIWANCTPGQLGTVTFVYDDGT